MVYSTIFPPYPHLSPPPPQGLFSEEGLLQIWGELVKDGEIQGSGGTYRDCREQEAENVKFRTSPFESFLAEWTWGEVGCRYIGVWSEYITLVQICLCTV